MLIVSRFEIIITESYGGTTRFVKPSNNELVPRPKTLKYPPATETPLICLLRAEGSKFGTKMIFTDPLLS